MTTYRNDEIRRAAESLSSTDALARETAAIAYVAALMRADTPPGSRVRDPVQYILGLRAELARVPHNTDDEVTLPGVLNDSDANPPSAWFRDQRIKMSGTLLAERLHAIADARADLISLVRSARLANNDEPSVEKVIDVAVLKHCEAIAKVYDLVAAQRVERIRKFVESSS
jgi:hypothetical protein